MTFGMTLAEHLTMAASASSSMFYIASNFENEPNMKVAASNINIKIHQLFSKQQILGACENIVLRKTSGCLTQTGDNDHKINIDLFK